MKYRSLLAPCVVAVAGICFVAGNFVSASIGRSTQPPTKHAGQWDGRGKPYINFEDGVELSASYEGTAEMKRLFDNNAVETRGLASADLDEDGVPDLICGYACSGGGIVSLYRGNIDSIFPNGVENQRRKDAGAFIGSAFLSTARVFDTPIAADFVEAGDFDADGHWDIVVSARATNEVYLLNGDGRGGLVVTRRISLPGLVTSLTAGEINRADGLVDMAIGIIADDGPKVLIYEGAEGALESNPEVFSVQGDPLALALGQFDADYPLDLAVGAGRDLVIIHGRDRKLSLDEARRSTVPPASVETRSVGFEIRSVAAGDFLGKNETTLALLGADGTVRLIDVRAPSTSKKKKKKKKEMEGADAIVLGQWVGATRLIGARVSTGPADDLVILNKDGHSLEIQKTGVAVPSDSTPSSSVRVNASFDFEGELSAVLPMRLNGDALSDLVVLQAGSICPAILKTTPSQTFTVNTTDDHDDGTCDSKDCSLREAIKAGNANPGADAVVFNIPGSGTHTIIPISTLPAITDPATLDGTTQPGFAGSPPIQVSGNGNVFAGLTVQASNSRVQGFVFNGCGIGVSIEGAGNNVIVGNFVGTDASGTGAGTNQSTGLQIFNSPNNLIGGTMSASRNIISGNSGTGVELRGGGSSGTVVQGNFIGTNVTGTAPIGNNGLDGISLGSAANTIGGTTTGAGNVISANRPYGIRITASGLSGNLIQGNFIGTNAAGTGSLPNFLSGIFMGAEPNTTIGGTTPSARNVISGHLQYGIEINASGTTGIQVQGNFIGTDATGSVPLPNRRAGIGLGNARNSLVGGAASGARNVISASDEPGFGHGILLFGVGFTDGTQIQGNHIGTDATGSVGLGNHGAGIFVTGTNNVTIGGIEEETSNLIAFNLGAGIHIQSASGISIKHNSIFSNGALGIDLAPPGCFVVLGCGGVSPNDLCDSDIGANGLQNFPVLISAVSNALGTTVQGTLNSRPNATFTLEFFASGVCDSSGFGEGQTFIGSTAVRTASDCGASFNLTLAFSIPAGRVITATATDIEGNTSEFSQCVQVQQETTFNLCLQDESNGNILLVNSTTGEYQFTTCRGTLLTGVGSLIKRGCVVTLQVNGPDRRILARIDTCSKTGIASIQLLSQGTSFSILDRNTSNNTCSCTGSG